ncbi:hypothetical protein NA56DRAFT_240309 [Hyaloscypha hepaticicola]|uniref:Azaphilone pigments biosynthesis cluster protein L N-terminal domain-containing protein n=1 Tax=Hyaloscypha hepaticicola TaxID=2082293 RepID=A0A2J6PX18_9HELO|nr:hypothetical protein NA56DRAFT_240309 [Hyaloscypha hepaticicola]
MDGLSAAASGIAVASLAIQLVDSVREIRRFFRTLKDAPEELTRLLDLLEHMELMLDNIGKLVEPESDISPSMLKAIQTCEKALNKLAALIQKVKRDSSAQSPLKKSLGFFKLACKKEEVEEIERQLDRAVSNLNMVMTTLNLHGIQSLRNGVLATNAAAATITEVVLRMEVAVNLKGSNQRLTVDNCSRTSKPTIHRRPQNHKIVYRGFLGSITAIVQSDSEDSVAGEHSKDPYARDEWSWVFIPSFLSRCVQVKCASFLGSVERTLRTCPVLPKDHQFWDMCLEGDVTSIQELFRTREVSPYAIDKDGNTLLHYATWYLQPEVCSLLLDMGARTDVVNVHGW